MSRVWVGVGVSGVGGCRCLGVGGCRCLGWGWV